MKYWIVFMNKKLVFSLLMLLSCIAQADSVVTLADPATQLRSTVFTESALFRIDIAGPDKSHIRRLTIRCMDGCEHLADYTEETINNPVYVMPPRDGVDRIVSLWTTGSAYRIVIYRLLSSGVTKLVSVGSSSAPEITFDSAGNEKVSWCVSKDCYSIQWDGQSYQRKKINK